MLMAQVPYKVSLHIDAVGDYRVEISGEHVNSSTQLHPIQVNSPHESPYFRNANIYRNNWTRSKSYPRYYPQTALFPHQSTIQLPSLRLMVSGESCQILFCDRD